MENGRLYVQREGAVVLLGRTRTEDVKEAEAVEGERLLLSTGVEARFGWSTNSGYLITAEKYLRKWSW